MKNILFIVGSLRQGSLTTKWLRKQKAFWKEKQRWLTWTTRTFQWWTKIWNTNPACCAGSAWCGSCCGCHLISRQFITLVIPGVVKKSDRLAEPCPLTYQKLVVHLPLQDKIVTVSSVANAGHEPMFAGLPSALAFVRTQVVGEFTGTTVNPEAWETGELVSDRWSGRRTGKQVQALLEDRKAETEVSAFRY